MIWPELLSSSLLILEAYIVCKYWRTWRKSLDTVERWMIRFLLGVAAGVCLLVGIAIGHILGDFIGEHSVQIWERGGTYRLASLRTGESTHGGIYGSAFLIRGSIATTDRFRYYVIEADNSLTPSSWDIDGDVSVIEDRQTDATLTIYHPVFKTHFIRWLGTLSHRRRADFHVPPGTVVREFELR